MAHMDKSPRVQYESFNYAALMEEFKGSSMTLDMTPNLNEKQVTSEGAFFPGECVSSSRPLDFKEDGFYLFCRQYRHKNDTGSFEDRSTVVQLNCNSEGAQVRMPQRVIVDGGSSELALPGIVSDLAKMNGTHVVIAVGKYLDVWARQPSHSFFSDPSSRTIRAWEEEAPIHLVSTRAVDNAVLAAAQDGVHCIQLEKSQRVRSFKEPSGVVTSVKWSPDDLFTFTATVDSGLFRVYDVRASSSTSVASVFVQRGLFDHATLAGNSVVCAGLEGVMNIYDLRSMSKATHTIIDPFVQDIGELCSSNSGTDLLACGRQGFTLWKTGGSSGLNFRAMQEGRGVIRGNFVGLHSNQVATTDSLGVLREWDVKANAVTDTRQSRAIAPPPVRDASRMPHGRQVRPSPPVAQSPASRLRDEIFESTGTPSGADLGPSLGLFDWDVGFQESSGSAPSSSTQPTIYGHSAQPIDPRELAPGGTAPIEDAGALPLKELDDLIGYYLS